jgi:AraC-like DNA-binding protein
MAAVLGDFLPLKWCRSLESDTEFYHQTGCVGIGDLRVISDAGTAVDFFVDNTPHFHLLACFQGEIEFKTATGEVTLAPNACALLPSGFLHGNGCYSLAAISVKPAAVAAATAAIAGLPHGLVPDDPDGEVFPPLAFEQDGASARAVHGLVRHMDACLAHGPRLVSLLGLDDVIHRSVATLLHPELLSDSPTDLQRWKERAGRQGFDELLDYIRANLDKPLSLSELEARSNYSKRALQYAFRERLNATPKQWIREQRLKWALEQLQGGDSRLSVAEVALACGYGHVGHFSRDFKACFGINPSLARRV